MSRTLQTGEQEDFLTNLNRVANECKSKLLSVSQTLVGETERLEGYLTSLPENQLAVCLEQLAHAKRDIMITIEETFNQIEGHIRENHLNLPQDHHFEQKAQNIFERISQDQKMISDISKDLNSKDRFLEAMQRLRETDFDREISNIQNEVNAYGDLVEKSYLTLVTDPDVFSLLKYQLKQHIYLRGKKEDDDTVRRRDNATPQSLNERQMNVYNPPDEYQAVVYQHSPMKMGGTIVQKGSRRTSTYQYIVESPSQNNLDQENKKQSTAARRESKMSRNTENVNKETYPPSVVSVEGPVQQVSVSIKKEPFEFQTSARHTEPDMPKVSGFEENFRSGPTSTKTPPVIAQNWFDKNCTSQYLHFFQDNSKKLHILDLQKALKTGKFNFEVIELQIDFRIPIWHRSVITRQGTIYLTGGSGGGPTKDRNISDVYVYDPFDNTMKQKARMNYARNSHGICILQDHIYIVGGCIDEEGYTTSCERYEFSRYYERTVGEWEKIAPLNKPAYGPCLANYKDTYLYKFGGIFNLQSMNNTIERYDPQVDRWTEITYSLFGSVESEFSLMAYSGCVQISDDEIYIFGGSRFENKTSQTYLCRTSQNQHAIQRIELSLPFNGAFWNNAIVMEGKVYCLQNIQLNKSDAVFLSKKRVLCYDGKEWGEISAEYTD